MRKLMANTHTSARYHSKHFICVNLCHPWDRYYRWGMVLVKCFGHVAQTVKRLSTLWETWVRSLGWEDPLEKGTATQSSIPELCGLDSPWGHKDLDTTDFHFTSVVRTRTFTAAEGTSSNPSPGKMSSVTTHTHTHTKALHSQGLNPSSGPY